MGKKIKNFVSHGVDNLFDVEMEMNKFMQKVNVLDIKINSVSRPELDDLIVFSIIYEELT